MKRETNGQLTKILNDISDAFFALDKEWRFTFINTQAEIILQKSREELLGKNIWQEFDGAVGSVFYNEYHKAVTENITVQFQEFYAPFDKWFDVRAYPSEYGLSVFFRDVTERRRMEETIAAKLREQTETLETINRIGQAAAAELDQDKLVQAITDAATELTGARFGSFFYNV